MLPLRDENPVRRFPVVTVSIIVLNVAAFLLWEPLPFPWRPHLTQLVTERFFYCHAVVPYELVHRMNLVQSHIGTGALDLARACPGKSWLLSIFEAMFLHAGWLHIGGNMLFLWVFGNNVEDRIGRVRYGLFYLVSGVIATIAQVALVHSGQNAFAPNLGASGAIAGVLGAYLVMFPRRRVLTLVFFFIVTWIAIPAVVVLGFWFVLQFFSGLTSMVEHVNAGGGVAVWAHVGGFVFGGLVALIAFPKEGFRRRPPPLRPDLRGRGPLSRLRDRRRRRSAPPPPGPLPPPRLDLPGI